MMVRVQFLHALASDVGVDLGRRQITMAEQHLHYPKIGSMVEQMRRKCVSHAVRRQFFLDFGFRRIAFDDVPKSLPRHAVTAPGRESVVSVTLEQNLVSRTRYELF